jgi:hypothetical protein
MGGRAKVAVDTNVLRVANRRPADACASACADALDRVQDEGCVLLDDAFFVLREYLDNAQSSGQPGPGDAFLRWVLTNRANPCRCLQVHITPDEDREFDEYPAVAELEGFDRDDRKFVAVVLVADDGARALLGEDSDWWDYRDGLEAAGVPLTFLCPEVFQPPAAT